jgi:hypothetical protein
VISKQPVTKTLSTRVRVLRDAEGNLQWDLPTRPSDPTWVALEVDEDRWRGFVFRLTYVRGKLTKLEITCDGTPAELTAELLQRVPLGALNRAARRCVQDFIEVWDRPEDLQDLQRIYPDPLDWIDPVADPARESDKKLAELCQRYLELVKSPDRDEKKLWRETLGKDFDYAPGSVQTIISRARKRRFLTEVRRGQSGGELTPKARRLLAPPQLQSAWDRATDDVRASALEREKRRDVLEARLLDQLRDGRINKATYRARSLALDAALLGWTPADLDLDVVDRIAAEGEIQLMSDWVAQRD